MKVAIFLSCLLCANFAVSNDQFAKSRRDRSIEQFNNCKCVAKNLCDGKNHTIPDGSNRIARYRESKIKCSDPLYYCCEEEYDVTTEISCGNPRIKHTRLRNRENTIKSEYPWIARIYKKSPRGEYTLAFGGALIHPKVVVTTAYHLQNVSIEDLKVVVNGRTKAQNIGDRITEEREVSGTVVHPKYNHERQNFQNNIGLIILKDPYRITSDNLINNICLPTQEETFHNMTCTVAGFSKIDKFLQKVELPIIEHDSCESMWQKTRLGEYFILHQSILCAGGDQNKDACVGYGGYPLVCNVENTYVQVGILSMGIECGKKDIPGGYTNLAMYREWMEEQLATYTSS